MARRFIYDDLKARYEMFDHFALKDQRDYYQQSIERNNRAASQIMFLRALTAFLTGLFAATAGFLVQMYFTGQNTCAVAEKASYCGRLEFGITILVLLSVIMPAFGAFFSSLSDLYQWDRTVSLYDGALEAIHVADALSPLEEMKKSDYEDRLQHYVEATLSVMSDETAQWGQAIRSPEQIKRFIDAQRRMAAEIRGDVSTFTEKQDSEKSDPV